MKGGLVEIVFVLRAPHELELRPSVTLGLESNQRPWD